MTNMAKKSQFDEKTTDAAQIHQKNDQTDTVNKDNEEENVSKSSVNKTNNRRAFTIENLAELS